MIRWWSFTLLGLRTRRIQEVWESRKDIGMQFYISHDAVQIDSPNTTRTGPENDRFKGTLKHIAHEHVYDAEKLERRRHFVSHLAS
jgi:hypothetical protein